LRELAKTSGLSAPAHLRFLWCYDEPEILRCSNRQFGPIGADAGHLSTVNLARQLYCVATKMGPGAAISPNMPKPISWNIQHTGHAALTRDKYPISAARRHHPRRHGICLRKASEHRAKRQSIAQSVRASSCRSLKSPCHWSIAPGIAQSAFHVRAGCHLGAAPAG